MSRLFPLVVVVLAAGCAKVERLGTEQLAGLIQAKTGLRCTDLAMNRKSREPEFIEYIGTATDTEGHEYDLRADVTPDAVSWRAVRRMGSCTRSEAEGAVRKSLGWSRITLQKKADRFEGLGVDDTGKEYRLTAAEKTPLLSQSTGISVVALDPEGSVIASEFVAYDELGGAFSY